MKNSYQISKALEIVKSWPADNIVRIVPEYGLRGLHTPSTPFETEQVFVEVSEEGAYQSIFSNGKWSRRRLVYFNEDWRNYEREGFPAR